MHRYINLVHNSYNNVSIVVAIMTVIVDITTINLTEKQ